MQVTKLLDAQSCDLRRVWSQRRVRCSGLESAGFVGVSVESARSHWSQRGVSLFLSESGWSQAFPAGVSVGRLPHRPERALPLVEVSGTRGYATVEGDALTVWPGPETCRDDEAQEQRYDRLFAAFLRAVETGGESPIGFAELYKVQCVLEAAYAAARKGKPVRISRD